MTWSLETTPPTRNDVAFGWCAGGAGALSNAQVDLRGLLGRQHLPHKTLPTPMKLQSHLL